MPTILQRHNIFDKEFITLQEACHVARCLKRFATLSTNDRVIISGEGGRVDGVGGGEVGEGVGNL